VRAVIQRVKKASVTVDQECVGQIGQGVLILLGIHRDDVVDQTQKMAQKIVQLRIFSDEAGKMNLSLQDVGGEALVVSQFTLYGNCQRGRRPDYLEAASPDKALSIYEQFVKEMAGLVGTVQTGRFGAYMDVSLINDGPATFVLNQDHS